MKKTVFKLLCLCLALVFAFSLVACDDKQDTESKTESTASQTESGENKEGEGNASAASTPAANDNNAQTTTGIVGAWNGNFSLKDSFNAEMAADESGMGNYIQVTTYNMVVDWTFNADGTFVMVPNKTATLQEWATTKAEFVSGMKAYLQAVIDQAGGGMTVDEYCQATGLDINAQAEVYFGEDAYNAFSADLNISGCYEATDGKLYIWDATGAKDENSYDTYVINGTQMTVTFQDESQFDNTAVFQKK